MTAVFLKKFMKTGNGILVVAWYLILHNQFKKEELCHW
jgi:hypothetical protein